jgi:hypothetical protein
MWKERLMVITVLSMIIAVTIWVAENSESNYENKQRCLMVYDDYKNEINEAIRSETIDKIAHLQAAQILLQIIYQKECCEYEETCPAGLKISPTFSALTPEETEMIQKSMTKE